MLSHLSMIDIRRHYLEREKIHYTLVNAFQKKDTATYVPLAVGVIDGRGNYSADEHGLGARILAFNSVPAIFQLAESLATCSNAQKIPERIYAQNLKYLKISVGSEMSMMLKPQKFWVANVRTIWADLLIKHGDDYQKANEILQIYRDPDGAMTSEMEYAKWHQIHTELKTTMDRLYNLGVRAAEEKGVEPGQLRYLWADAIANALYETRAHH